jgi:radical SAM protein with 4Fe4S-binding SPASM domain
MFSIKYKLAKFRNNIFFSDFNSTISKLNKVYPPHYVLWDCTRRCNLNCIHCGASKEKYDKELTTEQIKSVIKELADFKVRFFAVTGGEPLTRQDLFEVLSYASSLGIKTGIATNGFLIDEKISKKIKESKISSVQISLDGMEETHNAIRRNPLSFQKAVNSIILLKELKIPIVSVATTITPMNIKELDKLKKLLKSLNIDFWRIGVIMPIGRAESNELLLNSSQLKSLFEWVQKNNSRKLNIKIGENLPFLAEYEKKIRDAPLICPIGFTACCIGTSGFVRGCPEQPDIPKFREGSILEKSFLNIWKNGFRRYRNREIIKTDSRCSKCKNKNDCFGGCWVMREGNSHCIYDLLKE